MQVATASVGEVCAEEQERGWTLKLLVSPDRLTAYLQVDITQRGAICPPERVPGFVSAAGIKLTPTEAESLPSIAASIRTGSGPVPIANGQAPRAATRTVKWFVTLEGPRHAAGRDKSARVDTREVSHFIPANAGQPLCQLIDTPASGGRSVFGEAIPLPDDQAKEPPAPVQLGQGVTLAADGTTVVAEFDGSLEFERGVLTVSRVLNVKGNVDFKIGNIDFNGDVNVVGDVLPGFRVKAVGSVRVGGVVEQASMEAGGSIVVRGGVAGRHSATLRAGGSIEARYLHMIAIDSGASITIHSECLESHVAAARDVTVNDGAVIGGSVRAGGNVRAAIIGSEMGVPTLITAGQDNAADNELNLAQKVLAALVEAARKDQAAVQLLAGQAGPGGLPPAKQKMLDVLKEQHARREGEVEAQRGLVTALRASYGERAAVVEIKRRIHANVTIRIGAYTRTTIADQDGPVTFVPDPDNGTITVRGK